MTFDPGYGETPLTPDEEAALTPQLRSALGDHPSKAEIFSLEQQIESVVASELITAVLDAKLSLAQVLSPSFLFGVHRRLYRDIWLWAGAPRRRELSIGIDPARVHVELYASSGNIGYRWGETDDWTDRELGIMVHAEFVRIHPFVDGNGRVTRLVGDLAFLAAQTSDALPMLYDWSIDKRRYIELLRAFDVNRDPAPLAHFVPVVAIE